MERKDESLEIRISRPELSTLDYLADLSKAYRSDVLRQLIPRKPIVDALYELVLLERRNSHLMAWDLSVYFCLNVLNDFMRRDREHPIGPQIDIYCAGLDPEIKTAQLFQKWAKAKRGVEGYLFAKCFYGDRDFTFVYGPDDDGEKIKAAILDYAEKLYSPLPPLLIGGKEIK